MVSAVIERNEDSGRDFSDYHGDNGRNVSRYPQDIDYKTWTGTTSATIALTSRTIADAVDSRG